MVKFLDPERRGLETRKPRPREPEAPPACSPGWELSSAPSNPDGIVMKLRDKLYQPLDGTAVMLTLGNVGVLRDFLGDCVPMDPETDDSWRGQENLLGRVFNLMKWQQRRETG